MVRSIAEVAVNVPLSRSFHYRVPAALAERIERGHRVLVPFGARITTGVCVGFPEETTAPRLKEIRELLHPDCRFDEHLLELTRWIADYYRAGWGEVLESALPPSIRSGREERRTAMISAARAAPELAAEAERIARRAPAQARLLRLLAAEPGALSKAAALERAGAGAEALERLLEAGWLRRADVVERRDPYRSETVADGERVEHPLTEDQEKAIEAIREARRAGGFKAILLHGITGSGKTEVYVQTLREVLEGGGRGIVLLPEISLTPQAVLRFREGLPRASIAVLHSMLSPSERTGQWREIQEGKAKLVIGARSAAFAPIPDLQLIVVDEEHEPSYKQESSPRYHARDVAVVRARLLGIPVILGSATPALETTYNAECGKYTRLDLPRRATAHDLPVVSVVPLEQDFYRPDGSGLISRQLDLLIRKRLAGREQVLIYLNRRGFATFLHCVRCGFVLKCAQCDVSLTFHRRDNLALCHYCGLGREAPEVCPACGMPGPRRSGAGTEKVIAELARRYPEARLARLDRDAVTTHQALRQVIARFVAGEYDILAGTQMVAKGHDFPRVSLVGILSADTGLHFPDFRAAERTFQLVTQVSGRAGRGSRPGRVIVQTFFPDHYAIRYAVAGDYRGFYKKELEHRRALAYPPFGRLVKILVSGPEAGKVDEEAARLGEKLRALAGASCQVMGPAPSPISRIQGKERRQILIKARSSGTIRQLLSRAEKELGRRKGTELAVDVDPQSML